MQTVTAQFAVVTDQHGIVAGIGRMYITHPKPGCSGGRVKWFDDRKLIRQQETGNDRTAV